MKTKIQLKRDNPEPIFLLPPSIDTKAPPARLSFSYLPSHLSKNVELHWLSSSTSSSLSNSPNIGTVLLAQIVLALKSNSSLDLVVKSLDLTEKEGLALEKLKVCQL